MLTRDRVLAKISPETDTFIFSPDDVPYQPPSCAPGEVYIPHVLFVCGSAGSVRPYSLGNVHGFSFLGTWVGRLWPLHLYNLIMS